MDATHQRLLYPWYVACILCVAHVCSILDRYVMALVFELIKHDLILTDFQLGLLQGTGFVILYSVAGLPLGWAADRTNRRNLIIAGICVWSIATGACALSQSFLQLFACRLFVGIGEACLIPAAISLITSYFERRWLATGISIFTSGIIFGKSLVFLGGGFLLTIFAANGGLKLMGLHFGPWRGVFVVASALGVFVVLLMLTIREPPRQQQGSGRAQSAAFWGHFRKNKSAYAFLITGYTAISIVAYASITWAASVFVRNHGMTVPSAAALIGTIAITIGPLGYFTGGLLTDTLVARNVKAAPPLLLGILAVALIAPVVLFLNADSKGTAIVFYAMLQFLVSVATPPGFTGIQLITPEQYRGFITSIQTSFYSIVSVGLGPPVIGLLSDRMFSGQSSLSHAVVVVCVVASMAAALLLFGGLNAFDRSIRSRQSINV